MFRRLYRSAFVLLLARAFVAAPVAAQIIEPNPQPLPFPLLGGADFSVDPHDEVSSQLFRLSGRSLMLRSTPSGWIDMEAYCRLPERHWGPVAMVSSTLEVSGQKPLSGASLPARIALADLPVGSTITLRLLLQAPLIVLDLDGNPTAVLDTFVEEDVWRITANRRA